MKELPFQDKFAKNVNVANAADVINFVAEIEKQPAIEGAVLDTVTFLMDMYERQYVRNSHNGQKAWGDYGAFYGDLIHAIKAGTKDYAIFAHEETVYNEDAMATESKIPIKGAVGKKGMEADFTTILAAKQIPVKVLDEHPNDLLTITDEEREDGVKYVFQTRPFQGTGDKTRSAMRLWSRKELYIDNDLELVFKRLKEYYT